MSHTSLLANAYLALEKGDLVRAQKLFVSLKEFGLQEAEEGYKRACDHIVRRHWKQGKHDRMLQETLDPEEIALAIARVQGTHALTQVSKQHPEYLLATCALEPSVQSALLNMRKVPQYRNIAEGWLALLKQDYERSRHSFTKAMQEQPKRACLGLLVLDLLQGSTPQCHKKYATLFKIALSLFPHFSHMIGREKTVQGVTCSKERIIALFYKSTYKDLELFEKQIPKEETLLRAQLLLRMGDLAYAHMHKEALAKQRWTQALDCSFELALDVYKRTWLCMRNPDSFEIFLSALYIKDVTLAARFLLSILTHVDATSIYLTCSIPDAICKTWTQQFTDIDSILRSSLFWFLLMQEITKKTVKYGFFPSQEILKLHPFMTSNPAFASYYEEVLCVVTYDIELLQIQKKIAHAMMDSDYTGTLLACELECTPQEADRLLPEYVQSILDSMLCHQEEILKLAGLFPNRFDLARLIALYNLDHEEYTMHATFSPTLRKVLMLHCALDQNNVKQSAQLFQELVQEETFLQDKEAEWRLWHLVADKGIDSFSAKLVSRLFTTIPNTQELEAIFAKITPYQKFSFSSTFIQMWIKTFPDAVYPRTLLPVAYLYEEKHDKINDALDAYLCIWERTGSDPHLMAHTAPVFSYLFDDRE